ncbi:MAG: S1/P1 nuclease, partial [candidate division KSB1 bacterium]|nr:S1/P1 nuclease [candidate division KSB1 bacterium]
ADTNLAPSQRTIDLAWVLHLVGDIHQPLHCSARVTPTEPEGDRGGNLFKLDSNYTLHGYWDNLVSLTYVRNADESEQDYIERISRAIMARYPLAALTARLHMGDFEAWAKEGYQISKTKVYPATLQREKAPSENYRQEAYRLAEAAIALAGYRMAKMLEQLFGS